MKGRVVALVAGTLVALVGALTAWSPPAHGASGASALFGDGSDGAITFSSNTQFNPPVDAVVNSGTAGGTTLTVSGASGAFVAGQEILIHQTRGTGAGAWEVNEVQSYALGNKVTVQPLANTYATSGANAAQVLVVPEYTDLIVNAGVTVTAKAWNGSTGGILAVVVSGNAVIDGTISATGRGFRGGAGESGTPAPAKSGEGTAGPSIDSHEPNGNGGGGGSYGGSGDAGGGGGSYASAGTNGTGVGGGTGGTAGNTVGSPDLATLIFGGGGGGGMQDISADPSGDGGAGGGAVIIFSDQLSAGGVTVSNGVSGADVINFADGGAGAGGSILIRARSANLGTSLVSATGGPASTSGGAGGAGRIRAEYCTSISGGTADPPASIAQISCGPKPPTPTPTPTPTPCPPEGCPVGGIAELPNVDAAPVEAHDSAGPNAGVMAGIAAAGAAGAIVAGGAAWYARRRRVRHP